MELKLVHLQILCFACWCEVRPDPWPTSSAWFSCTHLDIKITITWCNSVWFGQQSVCLLVSITLSVCYCRSICWIIEKPVVMGVSEREGERERENQGERGSDKRNRSLPYWTPHGSATPDTFIYLNRAIYVNQSISGTCCAAFTVFQYHGARSCSFTGGSADNRPPSHPVLFFVVSTDPPTIFVSSFTVSICLLCGCFLFFRPGSSISQVLCWTCPLSLMSTISPDHLDFP